VGKPFGSNEIHCEHRKWIKVVQDLYYGFDVSGVEPLKSAIRICCEKFSIDIM
jgi:hypothetical protein